MPEAQVWMPMYDPASPFSAGPAPRQGLPAPDTKGRFAEDRLLDAVMWCEIVPGETVTESDVMTRFGLSRAAARTGLTRLGYDGWVVPQPRTGWYVLPVTGQLIGQVLGARRLAEPVLSDLRLSAGTRDELSELLAVLTALAGQSEAGAVASRRAYVDRIDGLLLRALDPFTAQHLRRLWNHTARITRFFERPECLFVRSDAPTLARALLAQDAAGVAAARAALIDAQEAFFFRHLLESDTPLTPGSRGLGRRQDDAAHNRREQ